MLGGVYQAGRADVGKEHHAAGSCAIVDFVPFDQADVEPVEKVAERTEKPCRRSASTVEKITHRPVVVVSPAGFTSLPIGMTMVVPLTGGRPSPRPTPTGQLHPA